MKESAFPHQVHFEHNSGWTEIQEFAGMSLRDYFAAKALSGLLAAYGPNGFVLPCPERISEDCYKYADAMMKARGE